MPRKTNPTPAPHSRRQTDDTNNSLLPSRRNLLKGIGTTATAGLTLSAVSSSVHGQTRPRYYGAYYNLPWEHPAVQAGTRITGRVTGLVEDTLPLRLTPKGEIYIRQLDLYTSQYHGFNRNDSEISWPSNFFPFTGPDWDDIHYLAVHWVARIIAPEDADYSFNVSSDDDAWIFIDGDLVLDNGGIHGIEVGTSTTASLSEGAHTLDIYFADRRGVQSGIVFTPDDRLNIVPARG